MYSHVTATVGHVPEGTATVLAGVRLLPGVYALVTLEVILAGKLLLTDVTHELLLLPVYQHVAGQAGPQNKSLATLRALVALCFTPAMAALVDAQLTATQETLVALTTLVWPLPPMGSEVLLEGELIGQGLATQMTMALLAVPLSVSCQVGLGGCLKATLTALKGTLACVHQHVLHAVTVRTEFFSTHRTLKFAFCSTLRSWPGPPGSGSHSQCPTYNAALTVLHLHSLHHQQTLILIHLLLLLLGIPAGSTVKAEGSLSGKPGKAGHEAVHEPEVCVAAGTHHVTVQVDGPHWLAQGKAQQSEEWVSVAHPSVHTDRGTRGATGQAQGILRATTGRTLREKVMVRDED